MDEIPNPEKPKSQLSEESLNEANPQAGQNAIAADKNLLEQLDRYSIEDIVALKIARFLEKIGPFYPENMYNLILPKLEKPLLVQILRQVGGNQVHAAKILGINRNTLRKKIKIYNIT